MYLYFDLFERWFEGNMENLFEFGVIEVVLVYWGCFVGKMLLIVSMMDE